MIGGWGISCEIALIWMPLDFSDDQSTLVQAMAWCCQATSHYLSQCWPRSLSPCGVTGPEWVKLAFKTPHISPLHARYGLCDVCCEDLADNCLHYDGTILYKLQLSAIITQSNIVRYYMYNYRKWGSILIRCWIHKRHPIACPDGQAMGCCSWIFVRKLTPL